jgi:hypothetical protein
MNQPQPEQEVLDRQSANLLTKWKARTKNRKKYHSMMCTSNLRGCKQPHKVIGSLTCWTEQPYRNCTWVTIPQEKIPAGTSCTVCTPCDAVSSFAYTYGVWGLFDALSGTLHPQHVQSTSLCAVSNTLLESPSNRVPGVAVALSC